MELKAIDSAYILGLVDEDIAEEKFSFAIGSKDISNLKILKPSFIVAKKDTKIDDKANVLSDKKLTTKVNNVIRSKGLTKLNDYIKEYINDDSIGDKKYKSVKDITKRLKVNFIETYRDEDYKCITVAIYYFDEEVAYNIWGGNPLRMTIDILDNGKEEVTVEVAS